MEDNDFFPFLVLLVATAGLSILFGFITGETAATKSVTKKTIKMCVEKPADCKTTYDYFKIEEQK